MLIERNDQKNEQLKQERNIGFEHVVDALQSGTVLFVGLHPNTEKYSHQHILVFNYHGYAYVVPFVQKDDQTIFLKTIFPSRSRTKRLLSS